MHRKYIADLTTVDRGRCLLRYWVLVAMVIASCHATRVFGSSGGDSTILNIIGFPSLSSGRSSSGSSPSSTGSHGQTTLKRTGSDVSGGSLGPQPRLQTRPTPPEPTPARADEPTVSHTPPMPTPVQPQYRAIKRTLVIDPGHPSEVNVADAVQNGLQEVVITWQMAVRLANHLRDVPGLRIVFTRGPSMQIVTNRQRAEIANFERADLMVRLHCDTGRGSGITLYYPDRQGTAQGVTGPSLSVIENSARVTKAFHRSLVAYLQGHLADNGIKGDSQTFVGRKQGALTGSIFSQVPAITVEMVYLSNPRDAQFIGSVQGQEILAEAMAAGAKTALGYW